MDKHRNTRKYRARTSQGLEKELLSASSFPSWFYTWVNSLGHCNIYCFIYNKYIITVIFHFPGFLDHLFKSTVCLFTLFASAFHSPLLKSMASFQGTQVRGTDIGKHGAVQSFWPKQILLRTTVIHLLVLKRFFLFSAYLMCRWFILYLLDSKIFNQLPTDPEKRKSTCPLVYVLYLRRCWIDLFFPTNFEKITILDKITIWNTIQQYEILISW